MGCDMCGSEGQLYKAEIEGTILIVCAKCTKYGKALSKVREPKPKVEKKQQTLINSEESEVIETIVPNYATLIKHAREKMDLKQKDVAIQLREKESVIHSLETGHFEPSAKLAKKLERFFKITLINSYTQDKIKSVKGPDDKEMTLGDIINIKTRKR